MQKLKENLANLLKVKSIITLLCIIVFCVLAIQGKIDYKDFMIVQSGIITYYFTRSNNKKEE